MKNKKADRALQAPAEANRDKHINFLAEEDDYANSADNESLEKRRQRHDADAGDDGSSNEMLQREIRIDSVIDHHHRTDADDKIFDDDIDRSPRNEPDTRGE